MSHHSKKCCATCKKETLCDKCQKLAPCCDYNLCVEKRILVVCADTESPSQFTFISYEVILNNKGNCKIYNLSIQDTLFTLQAVTATALKEIQASNTMTPTVFVLGSPSTATGELLDIGGEDESCIFPGELVKIVYTVQLDTSANVCRVLDVNNSVVVRGNLEDNVFASAICPIESVTTQKVADFDVLNITETTT